MGKIATINDLLEAVESYSGMEAIPKVAAPAATKKRKERKKERHCTFCDKMSPRCRRRWRTLHSAPSAPYTEQKNDMPKRVTMVTTATRFSDSF